MTDLEFDEYQRKTNTTAIYPQESLDEALAYLALGLGESGEVQNKVKKLLRDKRPLDEAYINSIIEELGDIMWYVAQMSQKLGHSLSTVAERNMEKLGSRKDRGVLSGSGDDR